MQRTTISESGLSEQSLYENYNLLMFCPQLSAATTSYTELLETGLDLFFFFMKGNGFVIHSVFW